MENRVFTKAFLNTMFIKQNKWHQHGVLIHTVRVIYNAVKNQDYKMFLAAALHDIGKPGSAFQDEKDKRTGEYSFKGHEEKSYQMIKDIDFISDYTKTIVRYHYLIRDLDKLSKKSDIASKKEYNIKKKTWDNLSNELKEDLFTFLSYDDAGKGKGRKFK